ncbi:MAG: L-seryl-tRNA(Sec) selenium transferase [Planctomycetes bacterium]|nr:L-seryl-tRNA(Sec) selenium transferase [Planctomycetota bacterium]
MNEQANETLRHLPSVDTLLKHDALTELAQDLGQSVVTQAVRQALDTLRQSLLLGPELAQDKDAWPGFLIQAATEALSRFKRPFYRKVVNATGVILHTALGRAVLAQEAIDEIQTELGGYARLQMDVDTGKRSVRDQGVEELLKLLTGTEAATVVNNNAAATALVLNTVGSGKEVIVSRGQLVEIGGAFRLPDVMAFSGAKLVEVGSTNKTHAHDYENAITEDTAAILRVHPSNYKIEGFSSEVPLESMIKIAHDHGLPLIDDVGAGSLVDMSQFGFDPEPTLPQSVTAGSDIITCSADKLIGASQGGIILGKSKWIGKIRKNQFARIVRVGKLTLAALEATLKLFLDERLAQQRVPSLAMIVRTPEDLKHTAEHMAAQLATVKDAVVSTQPGFSQTGSGSLPTQNMPTTVLGIQPTAMSLEDLAQHLRQYTTPIFTRMKNNQILIDPRTLQAGEEDVVVEAILGLLKP